MPDSTVPGSAASDNEGLPPGFVPIWTFIKTPEGVVEYEHGGATMLRVQTKTAADVVRGDVVLAGGEQYRVTGVTTYALAYRGTRQAVSTSNPDNHDWPALHFQTDRCGLVRFPHEQVSVVADGT